ncbi:MAG TPA: hypothetical protein VJQ59_06490, partial [Candidatus Sulfotelmatobacter sp.]|nr:hypothetical protein [Candidatus Sulfotelmatobacter sp.]
MMAVLPPRALKRVSIYVRGMIVVYLVALLSTSFAIPEVLRKARNPAPSWTLFLPSCWFASWCQLLRGRANPAMVELARLCLPGIFLIVLIAVATYAIGYRRHFMRIAEIAEGETIGEGHRSWNLGVVERYLLPTPFLRGCFRFAGKTLLRSESHRLVLTGVGGLALVIASQALMNAFQGASSWRQAALTPDALSIPFVVTFLLVVGLRIVFEIPVEIRANWIFQLMLDPDGQQSEGLARRLILTTVLPWVLAITFVSYLLVEGAVIALLHTIVVLTWTVLLANVLLTRFHKLPFTCTLPVFKQHSIVIVISFCFGYLLYAVSIPEFESSALLQPTRLLSLVPIALVAWYIPRYLGKNTIEIERKLIFEESAARTVEILRLSE